MAKKKSKVGKTPQIFTILLLLFGLLVALISLASSTGLWSFASKNSETVHEMTLLPGVNMIGLKSVTDLTASNLCSRYSEIYRVDGWDYGSQNFVSYLCDSTGSDFDIVPYIGYGVHSKGVETLLITGEEITANYRLGPGWNAVVLPNGISGLASDLCEWDELVPNEHNIFQVHRWLDGEWNAFECDLGANDFDLTSGEVLFLNVSSDTGTDTNAPVPQVAL